MHDAPRHLDLYSLITVYTALATIAVEASYHVPMALLAEWGRVMRD